MSKYTKMGVIFFNFLGAKIFNFRKIRGSKKLFSKFNDFGHMEILNNAGPTLGQSYPVLIGKCVATLSTSINPIAQENKNCIYGPFEVVSTYYKYKMTNAPQMHLVFGLTGSYPTIIFLRICEDCFNLVKIHYQTAAFIWHCYHN